MAILAKDSGGSAFVPAPVGNHQAVCVDVIDNGMVANTLFPNKDGSPKMQHKITVVWELDEDMEDGRRFVVQKRYTNSLSEKATLRHDLESWRGRPFDEQELMGFDVERLLGASCLLNVVHKAGSKGGTFANVASVSPLVKGMAKMQPKGDYVRVCDRKPSNQSDADDFRADDVDDSSVPF